MKNQYFGDVNDYRKYGLLRRLQATGFRRLLLAWMLTPDDGSRDGGFRSYLDSPSRWGRYDHDLYAGLQTLLGAGEQPEVALFEVAGLLPGASFYSTSVPDSRPGRKAWFEGLLAAVQGVDLAFVDPDNGVEVRSRPIGRRSSCKYVAWAELEALWRTGCSLLVYQHFRREPRVAFASRLAKEFSSRTGARLIEVFSTPHALFLLAAQERHRDPFSAARAELVRQWTGQIIPVGLVNRQLEPTTGVAPSRLCDTPETPLGTEQHCVSHITATTRNLTDGPSE